MTVSDLENWQRLKPWLDRLLDLPAADRKTFLDSLADDTTPLPSEQTMQRELERKVHKALSQLSEREHSILHLRFGLGGAKARSLRNVSRRVGLSQEGVRRVEQRALAKLAKPSMRGQLAGLL